jgi:hypothetical protein
VYVYACAYAAIRVGEVCRPMLGRGRLLVMACPNGGSSRVAMWGPGNAGRVRDW